ncbi:MAG: hypothetical protein CVU44_21285 [Chloroflexi bacterium HGW-Chloroflexi-6]|nr:MAG: hypothetical protein CVU44_21285 [Chloroflexi bacterium HGW-Chloroflexi-6]
MNVWYSKPLGDALSASIYTAEIEQIFQPVFAAAERPPAMAVFTRQEPGAMHCEVTAYFSPAATKIALAFAAQPCNPPEISGLTLLAGSPACWKTLFKE